MTADRPDRSSTLSINPHGLIGSDYHLDCVNFVNLAGFRKVPA